MKKLLCFLLALCILCSSVVVLAANEGSFEKGTPGTWKTLLWSNLDGEQFIPYYKLSTELMVDGYAATAQKIKAHMENYDYERRCLLITHIPQIAGTPDNYLWYGEGPQVYADHLNALFYYYKRIGGPDIKYIQLDNEESALKGFSGTIEERTSMAEEIIADERYETEIRPILEEMGFPFYEGEDHNELWNAYGLTEDYSDDGLYNVEWKEGWKIWDNLRKVRHAIEANKAYEVAKKYFPDVIYVDYGYTEIKGQYNFMNPYGHCDYMFNENQFTIAEGTHSAPVFYGILINLPYFVNGKEYRRVWAYEGEASIPDYPWDTIEQSPYFVLQNDSIEAAAIVHTAANSDDPKGMMPWVNPYSSDGAMTAGKSHLMGTPYCIEHLFHLACAMDTPTFQYFNSASQENAALDQQIMSAALYQIDELLGFEEIKPIPYEIANFKDQMVVTGSNAGGKNVWRVTPNIYQPAYNESQFLVSTNPVKFRIGNQELTFPEGSFIYEADTSMYVKEAQPTLGYWVISPEGTQPVKSINNAYPDVEEPIKFEWKTYNELKGESTGTATGTTNSGANIADNSKPRYADLLGITDLSVADNFADVSGHWAEEAILRMVEQGVLIGDNGSIYPNNQVTRAEFLTMLVRALGSEPAQYQGGFEDVKAEDWFAGYIQAALNLGILTGEELTMNPEGMLSRLDMVVFLNRAKGGTEEVKLGFIDIGQQGTEEYLAVSQAVTSGLVQGYPDNTFRPADTCIRAEAAVVLDRLLNGTPLNTTEVTEEVA